MTLRTETGQQTRPCAPCGEATGSLGGDAIRELHKNVPKWVLVDGRRLVRDYKFSDFAQALAFVNSVGEIAEQAGHHPWIHFTWGQVHVEIWTHKVDGLTEADFDLAARIDALDG